MWFFKESISFKTVTLLWFTEDKSLDLFYRRKFDLAKLKLLPVSMWRQRFPKLKITNPSEVDIYEVTTIMLDRVPGEVYALRDIKIAPELGGSRVGQKRSYRSRFR